MRCGAHVKTAGGPLTAFERAQDIGAEATQIFLTPPQQWRSSKVEPRDRGRVQGAARGLAHPPVFVHGVYLINLATSDPSMLLRSTSSSSPPCTPAASWASRASSSTSAATRAWASTPFSTRSAPPATRSSTTRPATRCSSWKTRAGAGGTIGSRFRRPRPHHQEVGSDRLKVCIDTQHSFAAGYDLSSAEGLELAMTSSSRRSAATASSPSTPTTRSRPSAPAATATRTSATAHRPRRLPPHPRPPRLHRRALPARSPRHGRRRPRQGQPGHPQRASRLRRTVAVSTSAFQRVRTSPGTRPVRVVASREKQLRAQIQPLPGANVAATAKAANPRPADLLTC